MPLSNFARFVSQFPDAAVIDAVIDTTSRDGVIVPILGIWAYAIRDGVSLGEVARLAYDNNDDGFFYDELDLLDEYEDDVEIAGFYPRWPHEVEVGDGALVQALCERVPKPVPGAARKTYLFHHVDRQPYINILTRKPFAVRP
jgi:hypothetical protein